MNFETQIDDILIQDPEAVQHALGREFAVRCGSRPLVLFGAGPLGQITARALKNANIRPLAFSDNNESLWGESIDGVPVLSPAEVVALHGRDAAFVVTIYNPSEAINQLQQAGCIYVTGAASLWRAYPQIGNHGSYGSAAPIFEQAQDVRQVMEIFADEESQREYLAQLQFRTTPNFAAMPPYRSGAEIYFSPENVLREEDTFVDCGAFDGDTLRMLLAKRKNKFTRFIGFEPDPDNFVRLQEFIASLPPELSGKIEARNEATGARNETVRFHAIGTAGSGISGEGEIEMNCVRLDDALTNCNPTFIKMDIEGAELDALEGSRETIRGSRPILAVCAYHHTDHLWNIPKHIHDIAPDYKIYLRRYAEECWELVVYGVPPER